MESESPDPTVSDIVVDIVGVGDVELAEVLPAVHGEFVEERNGMSGRDGVQKRLIGSAEFLIAAASGSGVVDLVRRLAVEIRVARIDTAEIRKKRNEPAATMVDAVADLVDLSDARPRKHVADPDLI